MNVSGIRFGVFLFTVIYFHLHKHIQYNTIQFNRTHKKREREGERRREGGTETCSPLQIDPYHLRLQFVTHAMPKIQYRIQQHKMCKSIE